MKSTPEAKKRKKVETNFLKPLSPATEPRERWNSGEHFFN
jgi:hypothetical protein